LQPIDLQTENSANVSVGVPGSGTSASGNSLSNLTSMGTYLGSYLGQWKNERMKTLRPVGSFFDRSRLSLPRPTELLSRVRSNFAYFQTNYVLVFLVLCLYSALTSPLFLVALVLVALLWLYLWRWRTQPLVVRGWAIPEQLTVVALALVSAFLFYMTSATDVVFWLLIVTLTFIALHSIFYTPFPVDEFGFGAVGDVEVGAGASNADAQQQQQQQLAF